MKESFALVGCIILFYHLHAQNIGNRHFGRQLRHLCAKARWGFCVAQPAQYHTRVQAVAKVGQPPTPFCDGSHRRFSPATLLLSAPKKNAPTAW